MWEMLALKEIEARLSREDPELAAALRFGPAAIAVRRRERQVLALAICALILLFGFMFEYLWGAPTR